MEVPEEGADACNLLLSRSVVDINENDCDGLEDLKQMEMDMEMKTEIDMDLDVDLGRWFKGERNPRCVPC